MKMTMKKKKPIIVEVGVWADRLTYFAQNHHILETADFRTFPSSYRMTKAQEDYRLQEELYIVDRVYDEIGWEEFLLDRDNCYYRDMIKVLTDCPV